MKALSRKLLAFVSASLLISATPGTAVAQSSLLGSSIRDEQQSKIQASETPSADNDFYPSDRRDTTSPQVVDGPFAQWGIPTPPGAEGYEVNQATNDELNPQGLKEWHPTTNPNSEVIPGQMRSDREEIPAGIDKNEADKAEIREAQLANPDTPTLNARPGCKVYWPSPFEVCGLIKEKYDKVGGPTSFLLLPKSNELTNPDGIGKRSEFVNGYIYWHPKTGAHTVSLPAAKVWERHGWEKGFLGYPTTSDMALGNQWFKQDFQGGHVYTHNVLPATQASIQGRIYDKWQSMGAQNSELGYPISDELTTPDGVGRYNVFERGMIYWTPRHGAHAVLGSILIEWGKAGFEKSSYGYPVEDAVESANDVKISQKFEHKTLTGYGDVVQKIVDFMPGNQHGHLDARQVYADGMDYIKFTKQSDVKKAFADALNELIEYNDRYELETISLQSGGLPEGTDVDPINPKNRGDIFYSDATTARVNHGHNGIFVGDPHASDNSKNDTVEASGAVGSSSLSGQDDSTAGVKRRQNFENGDPRRTHAPRLRNLRKQTVNASQEIRNSAARWAASKAGAGYNSPGAGYRYNFAFNRNVDGDSFNCSSLVWAAYMYASKNDIDLDKNGGPGVYPDDVRDSPFVEDYE
ncbi:hypothetical protein [uncultured Corynebacterium sp.]|uniref:hypothetical protein n=1 Tax=uncultured Corynebacterium sp. TaxID=159447 RepID=UPI0025F08CBF|nr:hypothetical protein [uncultured Corynebacterium sp.]